MYLYLSCLKMPISLYNFTNYSVNIGKNMKWGSSIPDMLFADVALFL